MAMSTAMLAVSAALNGLSIFLIANHASDCQSCDAQNYNTCNYCSHDNLLSCCPLHFHVLIVILVILIIVLAVLYFMGRRLQKKQDESQAQLDAMAQTASMLIIDKKRMKIKESGLPAVVISQTPWYLRRSKVPVVKAKVGPKIMTLIADEKVFEQIPVKKEVKVVISGIYITAIKSARGGLEKPQKKQGFFKRHFGKKS